MIPEHNREIVRILFENGKKKKEIARIMGIDIKTVRNILSVEQAGVECRTDKILIDYDLLKNLHHRCEGYVQRMHEILTEELKCDIGYSTLTRLLREYGIGKQHPKQRNQQYPDVPGEGLINYI